MLSCAAGLTLTAAPARAGEDANEVFMASPEALALSGYDAEDVFDENPPATCNRQKFPGGCINQTGTVTKGKPTILEAFAEFHHNPNGTCTEISTGQWIVLKAPKQGTLKTATVKGTNSQCGKKVFTFLALVYTWTKPISKLHDVFSSEWTIKGFPKGCPTCRVQLNDNLKVK
jgi:hypothetical protein